MKSKKQLMGATQLGKMRLESEKVKLLLEKKLIKVPFMTKKVNRLISNYNRILLSLELTQGNLPTSLSLVLKRSSYPQMMAPATR